MRVDPDRMLENISRSHGLVFSQPVLLALVAAGLSRDDAYRIVQEVAMDAWERGESFRSRLEADARVPLAGAQLDDAFSLDRALRNIGPVFDALEEIE
jgi:adenylosuccinate lyase